MGLCTRSSSAGVLLALGLLGGVSAARAGIVIDTADVQPVGEPYFNLYLNLVIEPFTIVRPGDNVMISSVPYIGNGGSNLVKYPSGIPGLNDFLNVFDTPSSPFFGSFIFATNPANTSLEIIYTGLYNKDLFDFPTTIHTGATALVVPYHTVGVQTTFFPDSITSTGGFQSELTAPLTYTSTTNGVVTHGTVDPLIIPEPATVILAILSLPFAILAFRRGRDGAARRTA
jgi:hypothetical protein